MAGFSFSKRRSPAQLLRSKAEVQREHRRTRYGVSQTRLAAMLVAQHDRCAICTVEFGTGDEYDLKPCVDHDHETGKVRGLLCKACNTLLGRVADDTEWMRRAIAYLEAPR